MYWLVQCSNVGVELTSGAAHKMQPGFKNLFDFEDRHRWCGVCDGQTFESYYPWIASPSRRCSHRKVWIAVIVDEVH